MSSTHSPSIPESPDSGGAHAGDDVCEKSDPLSIHQCFFQADLKAETYEGRYTTNQRSLEKGLGISIENPRHRPPVIHIENPGRKVQLLCLVLLTLMAIGYTMFFAKAILLPIVFAFLLNLFLSPLIRKLERFRVIPPVGAILVLAVAIVPFLTISILAYYPAKDWVARAPSVLRKLETRLQPWREPLQNFNETGESISKLVNGDTSEADAEEKKSEEDLELDLPLIGKKVKVESKDSKASSDPSADNRKELEGEKKSSKPIPVQLQEPSLTGQFINTTSNVVIGVFLTFVLLYFLLAAGDRGLEKMVELMPTWSAKRNMVELTREIQNSISDYLITTTFINVGLGFVIGSGLALIGLPNPVLWGVMACVLNFLPFVGCFVGAAIVFLVAVVSFDTMGYALLAPTIYLGANLLEGNFVTPTLIGRSISLHPVWLMLFFSVVTWIWGVPGAVVAVPMLAVTKIVCDHIEPLHPLGTFLGR